MSTVLKKRALVNAGKYQVRARSGRYTQYSLTRKGSARVGKHKRRVNVAKRRRKLTPAQIKYFGTARQRAALRAGRSNKRKRRNYGTRAGRSWSTYSSARRGRKAKVSGHAGFRIGNTGRRRKKRVARSHRRRNVGAIYSIGLAGLTGGNPGRKRRTRKRSKTHMARRRRRTSSNSGRRRVYRRRRRTVAAPVRRRRRRANTGSYRRRRRMGNRHHSRRKRRNPGVGGAITTSTGLLKNALGVIGGAVATRYATQLALGGRNQGAIGYIGNAVAALVLGWATKKFMKSPQLGAMVTLGGFTGLALRMLSDLTPIGQYVNLSLNGMGKAGDTGIGLITDTTFYVPTTFQNGSMTNSQIPAQIQQLVAAGSVKSNGMGRYGRRRIAA